MSSHRFARNRTDTASYPFGIQITMKTRGRPREDGGSGNHDFRWPIMREPRIVEVREFIERMEEGGFVRVPSPPGVIRYKADGGHSIDIYVSSRPLKGVLP